MSLEFLQSELEEIYGVKAPRVRDFLVSRYALLEPPRAPEELYVREEGGELSLGLYLSDHVLRVTGAQNPHDPRPTLTRRGILGTLACAAEGVSHFVYLATRAAADRPVSLLELEVQAEVDKFALFFLHLWRRGLRRMCAALRGRLFDRVGYRAGLGGEERERYRTANRLAGGYARWIEERFVRQPRIEGFIRELRASYRLGGSDKLGHLEARAG